ncbi:MAG: DUF2799 domain-containing protein [Rhodocyclaceae bacterium]|nr:DUF2799 domain-containing protein [Rhodocyclaceae bacterium]
MIKNSIKYLVLCVSAALLASCATMTQEECQHANWLDIGLKDGLSGEPMATLDDRIGICRKAGIAVDTGRYVTGRDQGLQTYCRIENAVALGLNGSYYAGACPPMVDVEFRRRYELAHAVYQARTELAKIDSRSDALQRQLRDIDLAEYKRVSESEKDEDRKHVRKEFDDRRSRLRSELFELDRRARHARDALRAAELALSRP